MYSANVMDQLDTSFLAQAFSTFLSLPAALDPNFEDRASSCARQPRKPGSPKAGFSNGDCVRTGSCSSPGTRHRARVLPHRFSSVRRPALHGQCAGTARRSLHSSRIRRGRRHPYRACFDQSRLRAHLARCCRLPAGPDRPGHSTSSSIVLAWKGCSTGKASTSITQLCPARWRQPNALPAARRFR